MEEWRLIDGFPKYEVSSHGQIRNVNTQEIRRVQINHQGFPSLVLYDPPNPTRYLRQLNALVARAFCIQEYPDQTAVWHGDGDLTNCQAMNLRWERRDRVLEWNEMHRAQQPKYKTPRVLSAQTGNVYENAFACGLAEGELESSIVFHIDRYPEEYANRARYRYVD